MTATILITLCSLLLIAYVFDLTSSRTKIPSVLLLLLLGWLVRETSQFFNIEIPNLSRFLPFLGTIGLVLIVLDGSLELEFNSSKKTIIKKSFLLAFIPLMLLAFLLAFLFMQLDDNLSLGDSLINAIPFCAISSAVAISSVKGLSAGDSELIVYESSFSDILGVLFFNFIALNSVVNMHSIALFGLQLIIITFISFFASLGLSYLLSNIQHPIKFVPIVLLLMLIYAISEVFELPALIFILLFGLFLGNLDELKRFKLVQILRPRELNIVVEKFKDLLREITFLIRALFFLVFGFVLKKEEILNPETILLAIGIVIAIYLFRIIVIRLLKLPFKPLFFIAPRGLITILLFLAIAPSRIVPFVNRSLVIQVIILTSLTMMGGFMKSKKKQTEVVKE
jgi:cell volume regulation protein A